MVEEGSPPDWEMVEAEPRPPTPPTPTLPFSPSQDIHMGIEQLEVQEEEEEDGPPPGWNVIPQLQSNVVNENMDDVDDEEEGPPPGWDFTPKREQLSGHENKGIEEERQPTDSHFVSVPKLERENEHQDIEDDGPPPGWPSIPPTKQNFKIEKKEIEVGTELGSQGFLSPQIRIRSELEAVEAEEIGIQHEKSSIDLLQPIVEYKQGNEGPQPGMNSILLPQPQPIVQYKQDNVPQPGMNFIFQPQPHVTSPMAPSPLQISDTDIKQVIADEEGPPPGWHLAEPNKTKCEQQDIKEGVSCGWTPPTKPKTELQKDMIIEGAEGPPPGWNSIGNNNIDSEHQDVKEGDSHGRASPAKIKTELENQNFLEGADEEGPPPGWHSVEKDKMSSEHQDIKEASNALTSPKKPKTELEKQDTINEGPLPGWNHVPLPQSRTGSEHQALKSEEPPHGLHLGPPPLPKLESIKQEIGEVTPKSMSNSVCQLLKMGNGQHEVKEERSQPGSNSMPPPSPQVQSPMPTKTPLSTAPRTTQSGSHLEMGQMVCGSCHRLLSYARGAKYVKCSCCQTVNLVLEAHQVGQVKCGGCEVLLMYQFGAKAVQCAPCRHVTEIVAQNRRPPLSVQQARGRRQGISKR